MRTLVVGPKPNESFPEDYTTVDIRSGIGVYRADVCKLPFADGAFERVECSHVLEHLIPEHALIAVREIYRVLQSGGTALFAVPDIIACARTLLAGNMEVLQNIYSPDEEPAKRHAWGYTQDALIGTIWRGGFRGGVQVLERTEPHEIRVLATKN